MMFLCIVDDVISAIRLGNDKFSYIFRIKVETLDLPFLACFSIKFSTHSHRSHQRFQIKRGSSRFWPPLWRHFPNLLQRRPIFISSQLMSLKVLKYVPRLIWGCTIRIWGWFSENYICSSPAWRHWVKFR